MQFSPRQTADIKSTFENMGTGTVPGTIVIDGTLGLSKLTTLAQGYVTEGRDAYAARVNTWVSPLVFTSHVASLNPAAISHDSIAGLSGDDHTQYHNNARGDARYLQLTTVHLLSVYAMGTAYALTNTSALLDFGTTDPTLIIDQAGTYLIRARVRLDYTGATFAANQTVTLKLRRTNNTAADVANSSCAVVTGIITTVTGTFMVVELPEVQYVTTNTDDQLEIWGDVTVVPSAGTLDAVEASIVAHRLS